ncbi:MAG: class III extradiol ring-cleavage dioxygenase [Cyanobacteriota bacterium]
MSRYCFQGQLCLKVRDPLLLSLCLHRSSIQPKPPQPAALHDFYGFPPQLYQLRYPAPGDPALAARVNALLDAAGIPTQLDPEQGLDHGAWNPLLLIYPVAQIPVVQVSIQPQRDPAYHYQLGQALQPLREERVLILIPATNICCPSLWRLGQ